MASLKEVRNRIQSVISTQQITKAMKMVAAAKLRRAQDRIVQLRPYEKQLSTILSNITKKIGTDIEISLAKPNGSADVLVIVITSDRGLCGAFNTNIVKATTALIAAKTTGGKAGTEKIHLMAVGKKGGEYFGRRNYNVIERYQDLFGRLNYANVSEAAEVAIDGFTRGNYGEVYLVYNEFKNVATQIVRTEQLLPLQANFEDPALPKIDSDYLLEPAAEQILDELIPKMLKTKVYKSILESNASEQGARMTAMDKATDNAGELLKALKLTYNRTRQAAITKEILEIVGGAEALAG